MTKHAAAGICTIILLALAALLACGEDDDGDAPITDTDEPPVLPAVESLDQEADDDGDDDIGDDDDDPWPPPAPNPDARADAFRLFYRERAARTIRSINRFALAGDAVATNAFLTLALARDGDAWEVVPGPEGNNLFGYSAFATWKLYQAIGGRDLELTLIRMFEGMVFNEAVSGHPGLTTREALPGWTRTMDGIAGTITRTRWGQQVTPPVTYPSVLEQEILGAFYDGIVVTYRENPEEFLFGFKAVHELTTFATTYVFAELDHDPPFLRVSDCCSSFMISLMGAWEGAYWGNHNSRDNFTDYGLGFIAALEAEGTGGLPPDLAEAAGRAAEAARRTGDTTIAHDCVLMTVDEWHDYDTLTPAGSMNPDGEVEWQDLGSLASCQAAYLAQAISTAGLRTPIPEMPLPGSVDLEALRLLLDTLGVELPLPVVTCRSIDDAYIGLGWGDILNLEILGMPWYELAEIVAAFYPDLFYKLFGSMMDDFYELELGAVALCYYAGITGDRYLIRDTRRTLHHLIELQRILVRLVYGMAADPDSRSRIVGVVGPEALAERLKATQDLLYASAAFTRMFGIDSPLEDFGGFDLGHDRVEEIESRLAMPDTSPAPLLSDEEIFARVEARLEARRERSPWIIDRYRDRFGYDPPVRRAGEGYECVGPDGQWMPTENPRHEWFREFRLWFEAPLCVLSPETLDCAWAASGCAPADLDGSGTVDEADRTLFEDAWEQWGEGATCSEANGWCAGADLDRSGVLDGDDRGYLDAAAGCQV